MPSLSTNPHQTATNKYDEITIIEKPISALYNHRDDDDDDEIRNQLKSHIPYSLPVLRRLQFAKRFERDRGDNQGHVLFAQYNKDDEEKSRKNRRQHFAAAYIDLSRGPETEAWVYCTLEDSHGIGDDTVTDDPKDTTTAQRVKLSVPEEEARECDELVIALLRRIRRIEELEYGGNDNNNNDGCDPPAKETNIPSPSSPAPTIQIPKRGPKYVSDRHTVMVGSLHEILRQRLLARGVRFSKTANTPEEIDWEICGKWLFRVDELPLPVKTLPEGMRWDKVRREDVPLIQSRTWIPRQESTLLLVPSTAVRLVEDGTAVAWAFMGYDGTLMTLHVEEPYRGQGLAKTVACKLMRDHVTDYGDDGWGAADVFISNHRSQGVCKSIGGKVRWMLSWAIVDLLSVGDAM